MKKIFKMEELDCANCAAKMEHGIKKLAGVESASVSFMRQTLTLEVNDEENFEEILKRAGKICKKIEPGCKIIG